MRELAFEDLIHGPVVLTFDGRVVELFVTQRGSIARIHIRQLLCEATGPDRKGHFKVTFFYSSGRVGGFDLTVASETWRSLHPLVTEIYAAQAP